MSVSALARRYANAYFDLAREAGDIEKWGDELRRAVDTLHNDEVQDALSNPRLPAADRIKLALDLCDGLSQPARNLVRLLVERRRIGILGEIFEEYGRLADAEAGIVRVGVTTAIPVTPEISEKIAAILRKQWGNDVHTDVIVDPSIIGGLVIRIGDRVIDDSVRTHLQQLQARLA